MKKFLLFFFLFLSFFSKAQTLMTYGEVYDYDIGDIFISHHQANSLPPNDVRITITNKYYSSLLDTVFYVYDYYSYVPPTCSLCTPTITIYSGLVMNYTNLNDTLGAGLGVPPFYTGPNCIDTAGFTGTWLDSSYYDSQHCNILTTRIERLENYYYLDSCVQCFECFYGYIDYGKGVGQKYYFYNDCADASNYPCYFISELIWYKKGNDSCGTMPVIMTIAEEMLNNSLTIFPNPTHDNFTLTLNRQIHNGELIIYDVTGREIMEQKINSPLSTVNCQFAQGVYFLEVVMDGERVVRKMLKE